MILMNESQYDNQAVKPGILIVEDNDAFREFLRNWLSDNFTGCSLQEARSGEEAVAMARAMSPDIVLMDIGLPRMNGIEATKRIKKFSPKTQVVMLTMHVAPAYKSEAIKARASAYLLKEQIDTDLIYILKNLLSNLANTEHQKT